MYLVTTLTKKLSEDLAGYLQEIGVKAKYLHSEIDTLERVRIIQQLRRGEFDVLVGINLLREGLDIPEVALVVILDADKQGFLRSETSLIQTCGRAARNVEGRVIMYADTQTAAIQKTLDITTKRRLLQEAHNLANGITPKTIKKEISQDLQETFGEFIGSEAAEDVEIPSPAELEKKISSLEKEMRKAAKELRFEDAAKLRDDLQQYQKMRLLEDEV